MLHDISKLKKNLIFLWKEYEIFEFLILKIWVQYIENCDLICQYWKEM